MAASNIVADEYIYHSFNKPTEIKFNTGDIITIHLDLDRATLSLSKNNKFIKKSIEKNIDVVYDRKFNGYRLAISMRNKTKIKMLSYNMFLDKNICRQCRRLKKGRVDNYNDRLFYCNECWLHYDNYCQNMQ